VCRNEAIAGRHSCSCPALLLLLLLLLLLVMTVLPPGVAIDDFITDNGGWSSTIRAARSDE